MNENVSYTTINLDSATSEMAIFFYMKYSVNNFVIIKKKTILFKSPIQLVMTSRVPFADALDRPGVPMARAVSPAACRG